MFRSRKKSEFFDKPLPPTWDQMEEDLKTSTKNDIIFNCEFAKSKIEQGNLSTIKFFIYKMWILLLEYHLFFSLFIT